MRVCYFALDTRPWILNESFKRSYLSLFHEFGCIVLHVLVTEHFILADNVGQ